jgi:sporulation protein YqfC
LFEDEPFFYAVGQQKIKIQNYKKILHYSPKEMVLLLKNQHIVIQGNHLDIEYFNQDEICIRGHIVSITYQGN